MPQSKGLIPCAAITHKGRMLLLQRASDVPRNPNVWVMPGGKIEPGETPRICAARELGEETSIGIHEKNLEIIDIFVSPTAEGDWYDLAVYAFEFTEKRPQVVIEDAKFQGYGWFTTDEMLRLQVADPAHTVAMRVL